MSAKVIKKGSKSEEMLPSIIDLEELIRL